MCADFTRNPNGRLEIERKTSTMPSTYVKPLQKDAFYTVLSAKKLALGSHLEFEMTLI